MSDFYRDGRLVDNLPKLIIHNINQFTPELLDRINKHVNESETGFFDTHPCDRERFESARKEATEGVFQLEISSEVLFSDFNDLCKRVTWDFYKGIFEGNLKRDQVHPVEELLERQDVENEDFKALYRYFQGTFQGNRYLMLSKGAADLTEDMAEGKQFVQDQRGKFLEGVTKYKEDARLYTKVSSTMREKLEQELQTFETIAAKRLRSTLQLLESPGITQQLEDATKLRAKATSLLEINKKLNSNQRTIMELSAIIEKQSDLFQSLSKDNQNDSAIQSILHNSDQILEAVGKVRNSLFSLPYPFDHANKKITVGYFLQSDLGKDLGHDQIFHIGDSFIQSFVRFRARVLGHLCVIAEKVEEAIGMEPLVEPSDEDEDLDIMEST